MNMPRARFALAGALCAATVCAAPATSELELAECAVAGAEEHGLCGRLAVPENWEHPGKRRIELNVLVIPAVKPTGRAPLFDLPGGPGMAATAGADFYFKDGQAYRQDRDVVLVDQRGTGGSAPLRCAALESAPPEARMYPPEDVRRCREELAAGHDLTQYTTADAVRDIEAVRQALGAARIDLFGMSYGTKLAQAYIRAYPERVHAAAFIGTVPIDLRTPLDHAAHAENTLRSLFADCAGVPDCAASYPALAAEWQAVLSRFDAAPVAMKVGGTSLEVSRGPFTEALRATMTTEAGQRRIPALVHAAAQGDFAPFVEAVGPGGSSPIAEGLYLSVECSESAPRIAASAIPAATSGTFLGRYRVDEQLGACRDWPRRDFPEEFFAAVQSPVPVLFIAGRRDHVAPLRYAESVARGFPNSRIVAVEGMGHFPLAMSNLECLDEIMLAFYESADPASVDAGCVASMKAPPFAPPAR